MIAIRTRVYDLLFNRAKIRTKNEWTPLCDTPGADVGHRPQGLTYADGKLFLSNHWNGKESSLFRINPDTGEIESHATLPAEAKHTSGITWDGKSLWMVDHDWNVLYKIDVESTFRRGKAVVEKKMETGLSACSGLTLINVNDRQYVVISDFLWTIETSPSLPIGSAQTYVVPVDRVWDAPDISSVAELVYSNGGYSQGLTWDGTYLYESLNNIGTNRIEIIDITLGLTDQGDGSVRRIGSFEAPGYFVEDLATDGNSMWTTDEIRYKLFELDIFSHVIQKLKTRGDTDTISGLDHP